MKKLVSTALVLMTILIFPVTASAGQSSSYYNGAKVTANCGTSSSWHQVSGKTYPSATGRLYYTYNGVTKSKSTLGTSYSGYWYGSIYVNGTAYKATTTYSGYTVAAVP